MKSTHKTWIQRLSVLLALACGCAAAPAEGADGFSIRFGDTERTDGESGDVACGEENGFLSCTTADGELLATFDSANAEAGTLVEQDVLAGLFERADSTTFGEGEIVRTRGECGGVIAGLSSALGAAFRAPSDVAFSRVWESYATARACETSTTPVRPLTLLRTDRRNENGMDVSTHVFRVDWSKIPEEWRKQRRVAFSLTGKAPSPYLTEPIPSEICAVADGCVFEVPGDLQSSEIRMEEVTPSAIERATFRRSSVTVRMSTHAELVRYGTRVNSGGVSIDYGPSIVVLRVGRN